MNLFCRLFGHSRSKRRAPPVAGLWISHCRRCDIRLIRLAPGEWHIFSPEPLQLAADTLAAAGPAEVAQSPSVQTAESPL